MEAVMAKTDIARRVYNHAWKLDPIVRSLLDTDFYKLLMLQMIWGLYPKVDATFSLINRTTSVRLADEIDEGELRAQLDHARTLRFSKKEMIWLAGNSFYGRKQIFQPEFLNWLHDFQLPEYELRRKDGQYELHFHGAWSHTTMWEIPALAIINELRSRAAMKNLGPFSLDVLYARAKAKMWSKVERLRQLPGLKISDFGTRRRHSFLWFRALSRPAGLEPLLWRQSSDRAARCFRHGCLPAQCAGLGCRLDRLPPRQRPAHRRRRAHHRMVEVTRQGPARKAADLFRRA